MRIAYGVHGYSRGHATRAAAVLPALCERHQVRIYAGGDAYETLARRWPVNHIPTLSFEYDDGGRICHARTLRRNAPLVRDLTTGGRTLGEVVEDMRVFGPDVVITDAEAWTSRAARRLGVPRIGFDHFGVMVHARPAMDALDRVRSLSDRFLYSQLLGRPERILVSSFYEAPPRGDDVRFVPPLLREEVHRVQPEAGAFVLVYLNRGRRQLTPRVEAALQGAGVDIRLYGSDRLGREGRIEFRPLGNQAFLRDLATCRAVISTAGNQLVGEALHYGKSMLVMPERTVEQRLNARAVESLGVGRATRMETLTADEIRAFLEAAPEMAERARARDGRDEAVDLLTRWVRELGTARRPVTVTAEEVAA
jgi:uncharacterized protein (TIGR00661 family)